MELFVKKKIPPTPCKPGTPPGEGHPGCVEDFKAGLMDRLGLDVKTLIDLNPGLIYCSISGFGQTGPYRDRSGYDQILQGMSGLMSITGTEELGPVRVGLAIGDIITALFVPYGMLSALYAREKIGNYLKPRRRSLFHLPFLGNTPGLFYMKSVSRRMKSIIYFRIT